MADDERAQADRHDARAALALVVERLELIHDYRIELLTERFKSVRALMSLISTEYGIEYIVQALVFIQAG
jgi:hypothetical protein